MHVTRVDAKVYFAGAYTPCTLKLACGLASDYSFLSGKRSTTGMYRFISSA